MADVEFDDWEVLQHKNSDSESVSAESLDEIGLIHADYFSLDSVKRYGQDLDDSKSAVSDNPSWIDPGLEENPTRYLNKESTDFWSDSSSDNNFTDFLLTNQMDKQSEIAVDVDVKGDRAVELGNPCSDSGTTEVVDSANLSPSDDGDEIDKIGVVWWKMPMEFLKYFVFRMSPVWTVSVAAAVMGFVILGRRLYKMKKRKTRGLQIKVAVDDKKISQVTSRAARLNEAFSVVKRVPVIRPSLPAIGMTTWPTMTIR